MMVPRCLPAAFLAGGMDELPAALRCPSRLRGRSLPSLPIGRPADAHPAWTPDVGDLPGRARRPAECVRPSAPRPGGRAPRCPSRTSRAASRSLRHLLPAGAAALTEECRSTSCPTVIRGDEAEAAHLVEPASPCQREVVGRAAIVAGDIRRGGRSPNSRREAVAELAPRGRSPSRRRELRAAMDGRRSRRRIRAAGRSPKSRREGAVAELPPRPLRTATRAGLVFENAGDETAPLTVAADRAHQHLQCRAAAPPRSGPGVEEHVLAIGAEDEAENPLRELYPFTSASIGQVPLPCRF